MARPQGAPSGGEERPCEVWGSRGPGVRSQEMGTGSGDPCSWATRFTATAPSQAPEGIPGGQGGWVGGKQVCTGLAVGTRACSARGHPRGRSKRRWRRRGT